VSWNRAAERIYGYRADAVIGQSAALLLAPGRELEWAEMLRDIARGKKVENAETLRRRMDGAIIEVSLTVSPIRDAVGRVTGASSIARDVTQRKQLEREVLEISAEERRRIGHELHDGLGQYLAGIAFRAKALEQALVSQDSPQARDASELTGLISGAIRQTRELARGLDPIEVESSGIVAALQRLAAETQNLFDVRCQFHCPDPEVKIEPRTGAALYRLAQEAIHNAIAHGDTRRIDVTVSVEGGRCCLRIRDWGIGFEVEKANRSGIGLRVMDYRARSIGGALRITSHPGEGTEVLCSVPHAAYQVAAEAPIATAAASTRQRNGK
jgi:PAS domain S-box-containing protein